MQGTSTIRLRRRLALSGASAVLLGCALAAPALGSTAHVVAPDETLSGIAAANGLSTETLAAWNGLSSDYMVVEGTTIDVPTPEETGVSAAAPTASTGTASTAAGTHVVVAGETLGSIAAANGVAVSDLAAVNGMSETELLIEGATLSIPAASTSTSTSTSTAAPSSGLGSVYSPYGTVYLDAAAADTWNAMRDASLSQYGVDLYPGGTLSGYRTGDQQAALYQQYLDGTGAPANPPGYSSHELGLSVDVPTEEMASVVGEIGWQYGWGRYEAPGEWWHMSSGG